MLLLSLSWYKIIMIALALISENIHTINTSFRYFYFLGMMLLLGKHQFIVSSIDDSGTSESAGSHSVVSSSPTTSLRKEISSKLKSRRGSSNLVRYFFDTFLFCFTALTTLIIQCVLASIAPYAKLHYNSANYPHFQLSSHFSAFSTNFFFFISTLYNNFFHAC